MASDSKLVLVTGDLLLDHNLVNHPQAPTGYDQPFEKTVMQTVPGGAWFLNGMVETACADLDGEDLAPSIVCHEVFSHPTKEQPVAKAYTVWSAHNRATSNRQQVWRISQFLGCQAHEMPENGQQLMAVPLESERSGEAMSAPSILVLDDLCLGFRENPKLWPTALDEGGDPQQIILKLSAPPDESPLMKELLGTELRNRLTIVISANDLRQRGARLSTGLSWDRTVREIVAEFREGTSAYDLANCRRVIVYFGSAGAASFTRCRLKLDPPPGWNSEQPAIEADELVSELAQFERFVYLPNQLEGAFKAQHSGTMFGSGSILTAALVRHELDRATYPLFISLARGLAAMRWNLNRGGGILQDGTANPNPDHETIKCLLHPDVGEAKPEEAEGGNKKRSPELKEIQQQIGVPGGERTFASAFPHKVLSDSILSQQDDGEPNLLRDLTGPGLEYVAAIATDVVIRGPEKALAKAPEARYGHYLTVDREEIERINTIRSLMTTYLHNHGEKRPLSIAVFGPPGSGKSFAIKQLAETLFGKGQKPLEFNLSQFESPSGTGIRQLHEAFHLVRDATVKGAIPLVFWDEFDTDDFQWLKYFLAPMQDAEFRAGSIVHPFGKAIFVFAGGVKPTFEEFSKAVQGEQEKDRDKDKEEKEEEEKAREKLKQKKGPDFVSRLRGSLNVKGPNPADIDKDSDAADDDLEYMLRRAMILRSLIERLHNHLIDDADRAAVSPSVIRGFLRVREFLHGARSMESLVSTSNLGQAERFDTAQLPPPELLKLHVSKDFDNEVAEGELETSVVEAIAEVTHQAWKEQKEADGYVYGKERCDQPPNLTHPLLLPYAELEEADRERNRVTARVTRAKLDEAGYAVQRKSPNTPASASSPTYQGDDRMQLCKIEHDVWVRNHMLDGYEWHHDTNDSLFLHRAITPFDRLSKGDHKLDKAIVDGLPDALWKHGFELVKQTQRSSVPDRNT